MTDYGWILAALFLPLFPLSMVFNLVFQTVRNVWLRALLLLAWPLAGLSIVQMMSISVPDYIVQWALLTAILYGFRAVVVKEPGVWCSFLASSAWPLAWVALVMGVEPDFLLLFLLAFSVPLVLLVIVISRIELRYESAYAGIVAGLAQSSPRLSGVFAATLLAASGSPLFPSFFAMLGNITYTINEQPVTVAGMALVWLLWSWSGIRLLQDLLTGPAIISGKNDISQGTAVFFIILLLMLTVAGVYVSGVML